MFLYHPISKQFRVVHIVPFCSQQPYEVGAAEGWRLAYGHSRLKLFQVEVQLQNHYTILTSPSSSYPSEDKTSNICWEFFQICLLPQPL